MLPARDPQALSEAIETLVKDPQLRSRMGAEGRAIALENYTNDIVNGMILRVYDGLLAQAGLPGIAGGST